MVSQSGLQAEEQWNIVKRLKFKYIRDNVNANTLDTNVCFKSEDGTLVSMDDIKGNSKETSG